MPTTCDGFAGLSDRILSVVLTRLPPMIRSYSRPSCPRTFSIAERILRAFSSRVKSINGSFLKGPSCSRTRGRGGASRVAIGFLSEVTLEDCNTIFYTPATDGCSSQPERTRPLFSLFFFNLTLAFWLLSPASPARGRKQDASPAPPPPPPPAPVAP